MPVVPLGHGLALAHESAAPADETDAHLARVGVGVRVGVRVRVRVRVGVRVPRTK